MGLMEMERKTNIILLLLIAILGLTAVFEAEYSHIMVFYAYLVAVPITIYYLFKETCVNSLSFGLHVPLITFLMISAISLFWTINFNESLGELYKLVFYVLLYYLAAAYLKERDTRKLITAVLIFGTCIALIGILLFLFIKTQRIASVFNNSNPFGMYLAMLSLAGMGIYVHDSKNRWLGIALVIITSAMILTGSRGSLISYCLAFPLVLIFVSRNQLLSKIRSISIIFSLVAISVFLISTIAPWIQNTGFNVGTLNTIVIRDSSPSSSSVIGRLAFWRVAWNMIQAHPFTGLGLGTYHVAYNSFRTDDKWWSMFAHNNYLQIWAETGIFALVSFVLFFFIFYLLALKEIKSVHQNGLYRGLLAACLAFLLHTFVDFTWNMPPVTMMFWAFLGSITALKSNECNIFLEKKKKLLQYCASLLLFLLFLGSVQQLAAYHIAVLGRDAQNNENYQEAINKYQLACRILPWRTEYNAFISECYYTLFLKSKDQSQLEEAISFRKKAIVSSPYDYKNYGYLGVILWQQNMSGAEENLKKAVEHGGFCPTPYSDLGYYYLSQGRLVESEQVLLEGLKQSVYAYKNYPGAEDKKKVVAEQIKMHLGLAAIYHEQKLLKKKKNNCKKY
ncbi:MAG: O-antigen ligase family protein [Bacillota bacterium]